MNQFKQQYSTEIERILARYPAAFKRSAVMPLLYLAQRETGRVSQEAMQDIADLLGMGMTEVASIAGFYTLFHEEPGGTYRIQVCTDLPCALRGAEQFLKEVCTYLEVEVGETTADGLFTIEEVKCLAACHCAPMFQIQGDGAIRYHENQTIETVKALVEELRAKAHRRSARVKEAEA